MQKYAKYIYSCIEKDMQAMIITTDSLTQKNVTHNCKPSFANPCAMYI